MIRRCLSLVVVFLAASFAIADSVSGDSVQERMARDVAKGKPLVAHVVVALCDNRYQRIVPVPAQLGNGDDPKSNLYWGALYGVKTYFSRHDNWRRLSVAAPENPPVLERAAFHSTVERNGKPTDVYLIAEAWQGKEIRAATTRFLELVGGEPPEAYVVTGQDGETTINAGGASHVVAYVGHNGLMDFAPPAVSGPAATVEPGSSIILACRSHEYFSELLRLNGSHSLLTTNGLMAPEAYTLEAAISAWFSGESPGATRDVAADAYAEYQKANRSWSRRLFATDE